MKSYKRKYCSIRAGGFNRGLREMISRGLVVSNDVQGEAIIYNLFSTMINYVIYLQKKGNIENNETGTSYR